MSVRDREPNAMNGARISECATTRSSPPRMRRRGSASVVGTVTKASVNRNPLEKVLRAAIVIPLLG